MTTRTFKQFGQAYGTDTCEITVVVDGSTVYSGPVHTVDEPLPMVPNPDFEVDNVLYTFTKDTSFAGVSKLSISVSNSALLLCNMLANYPTDVPAQANVWNSCNDTEIGGLIYSDCLSNEIIDGVPQVHYLDPVLTGQWWWTIPADSTFTADINIQSSKLPPPPDPEPGP